MIVLISYGDDTIADYWDVNYGDKLFNLTLCLKQTVLRYYLFSGTYRFQTFLFFVDPVPPQYNPWDPPRAGAQSVSRRGDRRTARSRHGDVKTTLVCMATRSASLRVPIHLPIYTRGFSGQGNEPKDEFYFVLRKLEFKSPDEVCLMRT